MWDFFTFWDFPEDALLSEPAEARSLACSQRELRALAACRFRYYCRSRSWIM